MPITGWSIEARLGLVKDIVLALRDHDAAKPAGMDLISSIIEDDHPISVTTSHEIYRVLRKTTFWNVVKLYLTRDSIQCARKGCKHSTFRHPKGGHCTGTTYKHVTGPNTGTHHNTPCSCPGFVKKTF